VLYLLVMMKKTSKKSLALTTETLRKLDDVQLRAAIGARPNPWSIDAKCYTQVEEICNL